MSPTPNRPTADLQKANADLQRQLAEARAERDKSEAQKAAITEVLGVINSSPGDLTPVFDAMLEKAMRLCAAAFGYLETYDGEHFHPVATRGLPAAYADYLPQRDAPGSSSSYAQILGGAPYVHVADLREGEAYHTSPLRQALVDLGGARSSILVALRREDVLLGSLVIYRREVRPFSEKEIALLQNFAAQAVIAMENARLLSELQARTRDLEESLEYQTATSDVLKVISRSTADVQPVLDTVVETAARLCSADVGGITLREGEVYRYVSAFALDAEFWAISRQRTIVPGRDNLPARVALEGRVVHVEDLSADPDYVLFPEIVAAGLRTALGVPLLREGALLGTISLTRKRVEPFTERQIELVRTFADQAVIAIENARLLGELQARTHELEESLEYQTATSEVLNVISRSTADVQPVLDTVAETGQRLCDS